jgi:hypothetical protein
MQKTRKAVLITFNVQSKNFENNTERNKFFRMLYGWKQVVPKDDKEYVYKREGLLDEMPHARIGQSSFIVPEDSFDKIFDFFEEWSNKVIWKNFKVLLEQNDLDRMFEESEEDEENE